jgi:hypothetical protein
VGPRPRRGSVSRPVAGAPRLLGRGGRGGAGEPRRFESGGPGRVAADEPVRPRADDLAPTDDGDAVRLGERVGPAPPESTPARMASGSGAGGTRRASAGCSAAPSTISTDGLDGVVPCRPPDRRVRERPVTDGEFRRGRPLDRLPEPSYGRDGPENRPELPPEASSPRGGDAGALGGPFGPARPSSSVTTRSSVVRDVPVTPASSRLVTGGSARARGIFTRSEDRGRWAASSSAAAGTSGSSPAIPARPVTGVTRLRSTGVAVRTVGEE